MCTTSRTIIPIAAKETPEIKILEINFDFLYTAKAPTNIVKSSIGTPGFSRNESMKSPLNKARIERWVPQPRHSTPKRDLNEHVRR